MKILLNTILGAAAMICFTLSAAAQTPSITPTTKKEIKKEKKLKVKQGTIVPANPSASSTTATPQEDNKGEGGRTRAIAIDEEGVDEETQEERKSTAPATGTRRSSEPRKAQSVTPRR